MSRPFPALFEQHWPEGDYRFFQLGHVVDDVIGAARAWATVFGVGPFHVLPVIEQQAVYRGEPATISMQVAVAQAGPVQIELVQQHCDRPSVYREWSRNGTSSFHQIATVTRNYDATREHYATLGFEMVAESPSGKFRVAYYDLSDAFGFYHEVVEHTPEFLTQLESISRTCANWDGTDPVRLLTRDGYQVPENG